jgi:hypothetical protein
VLTSKYPSKLFQLTQAGEQKLPVPDVIDLTSAEEVDEFDEDLVPVVGKCAFESIMRTKYIDGVLYLVTKWQPFWQPATNFDRETFKQYL